MSRYNYDNCSSGGSSSAGGIGFTGLLTIAFIVLKLTGVIDWSWWWVLSPMWISFIVIIAVCMFAAFWYAAHIYKQGKKAQEKKHKEKTE